MYFSYLLLPDSFLPVLNLEPLNSTTTEATSLKSKPQALQKDGLWDKTASGIVLKERILPSCPNCYPPDGMLDVLREFLVFGLPISCEGGV